jgi:hypothetical protein
MLCKSCRSCHTEHNKIQFALFGYFCDFKWILQVTAKAHQRGRIFLALGPWNYSTSQLYPRLQQLGPRIPKIPIGVHSAADGGSPPAMWAPDWQTSDTYGQFSSPAIDSCAWWDRRCRRQAATAEQGWRCRGCLKSGEGKGSARKLALVAALGIPREDARSLAWWCRRPEYGVHRGGSFGRRRLGRRRLLWRTAARASKHCAPGELRPLNRCPCLEEGVTRSSNGGRGMVQRRCKRRRPMASGGWCGEPMAEGGAAARAHASAARGTDLGPHVPLTGAPWHCGPTKGHRPASACVYGAVRRHADRPCTTSHTHGVPTRSELHNSA